MSDQLVEFLRHRKEHASTPNIDWQAKKDRWFDPFKNSTGSLRRCSASR
jgi:hypothetical protein